MEKIFRLGKESLKEIVAFDCLCFPNDFWRQEGLGEFAER